MQTKLVQEARTAMLQALGARAEVGQVVLYTSAPGARAIHPNRDSRFVYVEVLMWSGRPVESRQALQKALKAVVHQHTGVPESDIIVVLVESDPANWLGG